MNELLEKAKKDYPKGTKFKSVYKDAAYIVSKPIFIRYENIYTFDENEYIRCIYDKALNQWAEIIKEEPTLLEKAKRDYPIGTKCKSVFKDLEFVITKEIFIHYGNIYTIDDNLAFRCIYDRAFNKWAEIIKEESQSHPGIDFLNIFATFSVMVGRTLSPLKFGQAAGGWKIGGQCCNIINSFESYIIV